MHPENQHLTSFIQYAGSGQADQGRRDAPDRAHVFSRIGMIRYTNLPPSGDSIRPGRSGLMSLSTSSSDSTLSRPSRRNSGLKPISNGSPEEGIGRSSLASPT